MLGLCCSCWTLGWSSCWFGVFCETKISQTIDLCLKAISVRQNYVIDILKTEQHKSTVWINFNQTTTCTKLKWPSKDNHFTQTTTKSNKALLISINERHVKSSASSEVPYQINKSSNWTLLEGGLDKMLQRKGFNSQEVKLPVEGSCFDSQWTESVE